MHQYVESIFIVTDKVIDNYVYNGFEALVSQLNTIVAPLIVLAIVFQGYKCWFNGEIKLSDFWYFVVKVCIIESVGLTWSTFSKFFMGSFQAIIDNYGSALLQANPLHIPGVHSINMGLQLLSDVISMITSAIFSQAGFSHLDFFFYGGIIWLIGNFVIGIAMIEMIMAKFMMAALFTIAPIMFLMTLFRLTRPSFDRWLGNLFGFTILLILISTMLGMIMGVIYEFMPVVTVANALPDGFFNGLATGIIPMMICLVLGIYGLYKVNLIAMHIGGGASTAGMGAVVGGLMIGLAMSPLNQIGRKASGYGLKQLSRLTGYGGTQTKKMASAVKNHIARNL
jgi:type IV secretion system protein VirB6